MAPNEYVESVLMEDWSEDYAALEHWDKYWKAVNAPSNNVWPKGSTETGTSSSSMTSYWCRQTGSRRSWTIGTTPKLCIWAPTRCNEISNRGLSSLRDATQY